MAWEIRHRNKMNTVEEQPHLPLVEYYLHTSGRAGLGGREGGKGEVNNHGYFPTIKAGAIFFLQNSPRINSSENFQCMGPQGKTFLFAENILEQKKSSYDSANQNIKGDK